MTQAKRANGRRPNILFIMADDITNLRLDPYERTGLSGSLEYTTWMKYQFWRFVFVQDLVSEFAQSFVDFPPLQAPASFNLGAVKEHLRSAAAGHAGK